MSNSSK